MPLRLVFALAAGAVTLAVIDVSYPLAAADLPPADQPVEVVIDQSIDAAITAAGVTPAAAGRRRHAHPPAHPRPRRPHPDRRARSTRTSNSTDPDKRAKLVDRLIASPGFARHQADQFEVMFNPEGDRRGGGGAPRVPRRRP